LLSESIEIHKVASVIGKSIKTIEKWHRQYRSKGIESLNFFQYKPKQSYLNDELKLEDNDRVKYEVRDIPVTVTEAQ